MIKKFFSTSIISGLGLGLQVVFMLYAADRITISEFTSLASILGYSVLLSQLILVGYPQILTRITAIKSDDAAELESSLNAILCLLFFVFLLISLSGFISLFSILCIYLFILKFYLKRVSMGLNCSEKIIFYDDLLWILPPLLYLFYDNNYFYLQVFLLSGLVISTLLMFVVNISRGYRIKVGFSKNVFYKYFSPAFFVIFFLLGRLVMNRLDVLFVQDNFNEQVFSAYTLAHRVSYLITFPTLIFGVIFSAKVSILYRANNKIELYDFIKKSTLLIFFVSFVISAFSILLLNSFLTVYSSGLYLQYENLFQVLLFSQFLISLSGINQMVLMMTGNEKYISLVSFFACFLSLFYLTISEKNIYIVACLLVFYSTIITVATWYKTFRILKEK
ncbi:lipopolysaccharide biosynthesis protein [Shewanella glacialimarina]|uniref:lipopolysaccharide biosynthesis protein n=1 Tax=Shewanella glacialimarina TaxID=2590884 RepID=UPI001CF815B3|nr:hypothetical protein [Shewanella glacialimarina]UCX04257.1 hypothetical protein FJ709_06965 [Shewanella glacialimarina]